MIIHYATFWFPFHPLLYCRTAESRPGVGIHSNRQFLIVVFEQRNVILFPERMSRFVRSSQSVMYIKGKRLDSAPQTHRGKSIANASHLGQSKRVHRVRELSRDRPSFVSCGRRRDSGKMPGNKKSISLSGDGGVIELSAESMSDWFISWIGCVPVTSWQGFAMSKRMIYKSSYWNFVQKCIGSKWSLKFSVYVFINCVWWVERERRETHILSHSFSSINATIK